VLAAFPDKVGTFQGAGRAYTLRHTDAGGGERYRIAVLRLVEQGQGEAQDAARDLIGDLGPRLVLVVGIAGGRPSDDVKLGDVVVSTRIHDFTVEARKSGEAPTYAVTGGPIDKALAASDLSRAESRPLEAVARRSGFVHPRRRTASHASLYVMSLNPTAARSFRNILEPPAKLASSFNAEIA
jgi:nucleoside phosphorylase